jgi:mRNA interferase MazF
MAMVVRRFDVYLVAFDPTIGHEIKKTRPALVVSPDEMNRYLSTFIVAPLTTRGRPYPTRVPCTFQRKLGHIVLDQIRTVDRDRLLRRLGRIAPATGQQVLSALQEMFEQS